MYSTIIVKCQQWYLRQQVIEYTQEQIPESYTFRTILRFLHYLSPKKTGSLIFTWCCCLIIMATYLVCLPVHYVKIHK